MSRYARMSGIISEEQLVESRCLVVGVGAVGRQVALGLAAMGVGNIDLCDFDVVEEENLGPQGYLEDDLGTAKVMATREEMLLRNSKLNCVVDNCKIQDSPLINEDYDYVFMAADCMEARKWMFGNLNADCFIDGRMNIGTAVVLVSPAGSDYMSYWISDEDASEDPCTVKSSYYAAMLTASLMINEYSLCLRGMSEAEDETKTLLFNLVATDIAPLPRIAAEAA